MKTSINIFNRLTNTELLSLTAEVKETIADMPNHKPTKTFSAPTCGIFNGEKEAQ